MEATRACQFQKGSAAGAGPLSKDSEQQLRGAGLYTQAAQRCRLPPCIVLHSQTEYTCIRSSTAHASLAQECWASVPVVACTQSLLMFPPHLLQVWSFH